MPRLPRVAATTSTLSTAVFSQLASRAAALQAQGRTIYPLHVGDTWMEPPVEARAESQRTDDHPGLHQYAPVQGMPTLLDAIGRRLERLGRAVPRERLQVVNGATSGLSIVTEALLEPGDEVLLPSPFWPLIRGILAKRGAAPVEIPFWDRLDSIDVETTLEAAITPRTVAIYVNSPHNPTGRVLTPQQVDAIVRVARRHDLWVIADEAYQDLCFIEPTPPIWTRDDLQDRYVASHTLSKSYGLAGARVGYLHGAPTAMAAIAAVQVFSTYCAPRPMQIGAARVLDAGDAFLAKRRDEFAEAGRRTADVLGVPAPEGGTFLFVDASPWLPRDAEDAMPFLERALEAGVQLTPGASCGEHYARFVRVCFTSLPLGVHERALDALRRALG
jgi:N-succinyldiaminopimelate aminotransferase